MRLASSLALVSLLVLPVAVLAQPSSGTVFVSAGGFAAIDKSSTLTGFDVAEPDSTRTVGGGMVGVGVHLTERVTARVEWSMTATSKQRGDAINLPYYSPGEWTAFPPPALTALPAAQAIISYTPETRRSTKAGYALLGYHLPAGRATVELLAGMGILNEMLRSRRDIAFTNPPPGLPLSLPALADYEASSYGVVPVLGADITIALGRHAAVVPQVRVHAYTDRVSIRPGLAVRWTF